MWREQNWKGEEQEGGTRLSHRETLRKVDVRFPIRDEMNRKEREV
jgi:hypothetical protein